MGLTKLNDDYSNEVLEQHLESPQRVGTDVPELTSYEEVRNALIRSEEYAALWNAFLRNVVPETTNDDNVTTYHARITEGSMDGNPTLGYGFNLNDNIAAEDIEELIIHVFGPLSAEQEVAVDLLQAWKNATSYTFNDLNGTPDDPTDDETVSVTITADDIIDGAQGRSVAARFPELSPTAQNALDDELANLISLTLDETQAERLLLADIEGLTTIVPSREERLDAVLGGAGVLPPSVERAVVFSLLYNGGTGVVGPGLRNSLQQDNRAAAWFEIRYNHLNTGDPEADPPREDLQPRRDRESDIFRLISVEGEANQDLAEYKSAVGFLFGGPSLSNSAPIADIYQFISNRFGLGLINFP